MTHPLQATIEELWDRRPELSPQSAPTTIAAIESVIADLDAGKLRVAEKLGGEWFTHQWIKKAVLLSFRVRDNRVQQSGDVRFFDKVGAYVDEGTMVDTWVTVGSCAQIGKNVHLSGGVGIGGVLEPLQANPTIIEDNCFIGARSEVVEGVIVEENSVISMGVYIGQSTPIYDRATDTVSYGRVPAGSVVISGNLPKDGGKYSLYAAIIVKRVDAQTRAKTSLNDLLRD